MLLILPIAWFVAFSDADKICPMIITDLLHLFLSLVSYESWNSSIQCVYLMLGSLYRLLHLIDYFPVLDFN